MIYEMRVYRAMPGRMPDLLDRFEQHTVPLWERRGIRPVGFWTTMIGASNQDLTYLLAWTDLAEREREFGAFTADPAWRAIREETEKNGPLVETVQTSLLQPTRFSAMR